MMVAPRLLGNRAGLVTSWPADSMTERGWDPRGRRSGLPGEHHAARFRHADYIDERFYQPTGSLAPQRHRRIDVRRPTGGKQPGENADASECGNRQYDRDWVVR